MTTKTCFVIMPFSDLKVRTNDGERVVTKAGWTDIFEKLLKPAVEGAGLGYVCRRSEANRGNIVAKILQDLKESHVVLADLTGKNPNVFYELGVRHALSNRTIIVSQCADDVPSDLQQYGYHVYDYDAKTVKGRSQLKKKISQLLHDIDSHPERRDNPVSDFLRLPRELVETSEDQAVVPTPSRKLEAANKGMAEAETRRNGIEWTAHLTATLLTLGAPASVSSTCIAGVAHDAGQDDDVMDAYDAPAPPVAPAPSITFSFPHLNDANAPAFSRDIRLPRSVLSWVVLSRVAYAGTGSRAAFLTWDVSAVPGDHTVRLFEGVEDPLRKFVTKGALLVRDMRMTSRYEYAQNKTTSAIKYFVFEVRRKEREVLTQYG